MKEEERTGKARETDGRKADGFFARVYAIVKEVPPGKVATYGQIAALAGAPRMARQVGYALHINPEPGVIPCHRIVNREGRLAPAFAFGGSDVQAALLAGEGVETADGYVVDLDSRLWDGVPEAEKTVRR